MMLVNPCFSFGDSDLLHKHVIFSLLWQLEVPCTGSHAQ
jgi:hypothetical protein